MNIQVHRAECRDVEAMRGLYRQELNCQIIRDSFFSRGLADPYLILVEGRVCGYGAVSNKYDKGRLMEFYTLPRARSLALPMFRELLTASQATHVEAQTNNPLMLLMLYDCAKNITAELCRLKQFLFVVQFQFQHCSFAHVPSRGAGKQGVPGKHFI